MRLSPHDKRRIKELVQRHFGADAEIRVFGSRTDDQARGGDLDLYIETDLPGGPALDAELAFQRELQEAFGEQRLDLTVHLRGQPLSSFEAYARDQGVPL